MQLIFHAVFTVTSREFYRQHVKLVDVSRVSIVWNTTRFGGYMSHTFKRSSGLFGGSTYTYIEYYPEMKNKLSLIPVISVHRSSNELLVY